MKLAICLSGYTRTYKFCHKSLSQYLSNHIVDYYLQIWEEESHLIDELKQIYNPKQIIVLKKQNFTDQYKFVFEKYLNYPCIESFDMWYGIQQCFTKLKESYNQYDGIIRSRYDLIFDQVLPENINLQKILIPDLGNHHNGYNDTFAIGNPESMMKYGNLFNWLNLIYKHQSIKDFLPELILSTYLVDLAEKNRIANCKILRDKFIGYPYEHIPETDADATLSRKQRSNDIYTSLYNKPLFNKPKKIHIYTYFDKYPLTSIVLKACHDGMKACGETDVHLLDEHYKKYAPPHIIVTFGERRYHNEYDEMIHDVITDHKCLGKPILMFETGLIARKHSINSHYFRVGWNGFQYDTGVFTDPAINYPADRWNNISKLFDIKLKPWRKTGKHILLIHQVNYDSSIRGNDFSYWLNNTINEIKQYTDRPIRLRLHPHPIYKPIYPKRSDIEIVTGGSARPIEYDLKDCWAAVTFNSGAGVDSIIDGIPVFSMHPGSMAFPVSNYILNNIETPQLPDRKQWLYNLAYSQWNIDEIKSGIAWRHLITFMPKINRMLWEFE